MPLIRREYRSSSESSRAIADVLIQKARRIFLRAFCHTAVLSMSLSAFHHVQASINGVYVHTAYVGVSFMEELDALVKPRNRVCSPLCATAVFSGLPSLPSTASLIVLCGADSKPHFSGLPYSQPTCNPEVFKEHFLHLNCSTLPRGVKGERVKRSRAA